MLWYACGVFTQICINIFDVDPMFVALTTKLETAWPSWVSTRYKPLGQFAGITRVRVVDHPNPSHARLAGTGCVGTFTENVVISTGTGTPVIRRTRNVS